MTYHSFRRWASAAFSAAMVLVASADGLPDGWSPKFYDGLEAVGSVTWVPGAVKGGSGAMRCAWESGALKFGVEKEVKTDLAGWVDWIVEAEIKSEGNYGYAGAAMSFLDGRGRDAGSVNMLRPLVAKEWRKVMWKFSAPKEARRFFLQLLSLDREPVMFANVSVKSVQGIDKGEIPFEVRAMPAEKNVWWNGNRFATLNFSDAPIPTVFYMKGARKGRDRLRFVVEIPVGLEIRDAYCPNGSYYESFRPLETSAFSTNGTDFVRYSFGNAKFFKSRKYGSLNPARYFNDECTGIALVIGPKPGFDADGKTFPIRYRMMLDGKRGQDKKLDMTFRSLPTNLKKSKDFFVFSWVNADRHFSSDAALLGALRAYEAAGMSSFRRNPHGGEFKRKNEIVSILEKRPSRCIFAVGLGNLWHPSRVGIGKKEMETLGVRMTVSSDMQRHKHFTKWMCPEYFTKDARLRAHMREAVHKKLALHGVRDGDWVTFDMEPWHAYSYCHCDVCHEAFVKFAGLEKMPSAEEMKSDALRDKWALFRCSHNAKSVEILTEIIREYNPALKCMDYDYVMPYGDEKAMMARRRACSKDTLVNEQWLDGHLCSYYHKIDKEAFDAIRNDTKHLKKVYIPMGANDVAGGYLRPHEILSPIQVKQFAFASFVHGCPGIAFYSGLTYDGEILVALMEAQDEISKWEGLPWGRKTGCTVPVCGNALFAFASTVKADGREVLALFNYDPKETVSVKVGGETVRLGPYETRFMEVGAQAGL